MKKREHGNDNRRVHRYVVCFSPSSLLPRSLEDKKPVATLKRVGEASLLLLLTPADKLYYYTTLKDTPFLFLPLGRIFIKDWIILFQQLPIHKLHPNSHPAA